MIGEPLEGRCIRLSFCSLAENKRNRPLFGHSDMRGVGSLHSTGLPDKILPKSLHPSYSKWLNTNFSFFLTVSDNSLHADAWLRFFSISGCKGQITASSDAYCTPSETAGEAINIEQQLWSLELLKKRQ